MAFTGKTDSFIPGGAGMTGSLNLVVIGPEYLVDARNVSFAGGLITKEKGGKTLGTVSGTGGVIGGWDWWPSSGVQRGVVLVGDGTAYKDGGGWLFATQLCSGMNWDGDATPVFVNAGQEGAAEPRLLFIATETDQLKVLEADAATLRDVASPPTDWTVGNYPNTACLHDDRVWVAARHFLYYSDPDDHEDFVGGASGILGIFPGQGDKIVSVASYKGRLIVFKYPTGIYVVDTTDPDDSNWSVKALTTAIGGAGPRCWAGGDNDLLFMSGTGEFYAISAVQEFGDVDAASVSKGISLNSWMEGSTNQLKYGMVQAINHAKEKEIHFAVAGTGELVPSMRVVWDRNAGGIRFRGYSDFVRSRSVWIRRNALDVSTLMIGTDTGAVIEMDQESYDLDGAGYTSAWQTNFFDFGDSHIRKNVRWLEIVYMPLGNWDVSVSLTFDGRSEYITDFYLGGDEGTLDDFTLDSDILGNMYLEVARKRLVNSARYFSLVVNNSTAGQNYAIGKFTFGYDVGSERI